MAETLAGAATERMLIGGVWEAAASGGHFVSINPSTEESLALVPAGNAADVERAVRAAKEAAPAWGALAWTARAAALRKLASRIRDHAEELALLDVDDAGLPLRGMRTDVAGAAEELEYFAGLGSELKGLTVPTPAGVLAYTRREPYGVVGRIIPFNHPFKFAAGKIAAPLMAGNSVILKPSEQAPLSALELGRLTEGVLPPGVLNVVTGYGSEVGAAIAAHPEVPRVAFTGSVPTGRAVLRAGAEHIKQVTLELGGKNPLVVCADADLGSSAAAAVTGMNLPRTMGQSCQSNSRVFVHADVIEPFVELLVEAVAALRIGDPRDETTDIGPLAFEAHYERVLGHIEAAKADGARLLAGGGRPAGVSRGYYIEPTVFGDVSPKMRLAREEVFGPVVAVMAWRDEEELFAAVDDIEYGLTAKVWTKDMAFAQRFTERVQSGLVWVNGAGGKPPGIPFGGYKLSGLGKEGSLEELTSYTREKGVIARPHPE